MNAHDTILLLEMFPFCRGNNKLAADYSGARVINVTLDKARTQMKVDVSLSEPAPPMEIAALEDIIAQEYGLALVDITATYARASSEQWRKASHGPAAKAGKGGTGTSPGVVIMGKRIGDTTKITKIGDLHLDLGKITVKGEVCNVTSRLIERLNTWILIFDLTDYTGTIQVTKFMKDVENATSIVSKIKKGMWLKVSGSLSISRYDSDLVMEPKNMVSISHEPRHDNAKEKRVELHLHTQMSALDSMINTKEVVQRAHDWGHSAIAITDHGVVHSFPDAHDASASGSKIKVLYGMEGYFHVDVGFEGTENPNITKRGRLKVRHITLLARNKTGLQNLYKLVTKSHLDDFSGRPIIKKSVLDANRDGLIVGSACEAGEVFDAVATRKSDEEIIKLAQYYDYLEIMPICNNMFMLQGDKALAGSEEDLRDFNRKVVEIGKEIGKPVVATGDAHFLDPEHEIYRRIILTSKGFEDASNDLPLYFKTTDEMLEEFSYLGEETAYEVVVRNTNLIADMCQTISPLPEAKKLFSPKIERSAEDLKDLVYGKLRELYGENPHDIITARIETELGDILERGYDVIYMSAQKLVEASLKEGYLVGSRGSVGSSIVAFLAGITEVNSLPAHYRCPVCKIADFESGKGFGCGADMPNALCPNCGINYEKDGFNIPFETFLGFGGDKVPDIDLNFSGDYQAQAHKLTIDLFGEKNVYRAGTIGTIEEKTAFGYVKKYLETVGRKVTKAEENRLSRGCVGVKRTTGQHPGGLIIIPEGYEITDFCPAQHPADDKDKGIVTTHFEYKCMEDNLIKLDELGHDDPTMIKMLEDMTGVNVQDIHFDDPDTLSLFVSPKQLGLPEDDAIIGTTGAIGIPEFGTGFVRQMLADTKPTDFDTLVRISGFSHGEKVWLDNAKELIQSGKATVSETIGCRDDIMLFLISKGIADTVAFKVSESVRKGRGLPDGTEAEMRRHDVPGWYIESCEKINYLFPKAHAVAYVMMAFRIAWFKVHRPLEFYSAYFYRRSQKDGFDAQFMTRGIGTVKRKIREIKNNIDAKIASPKEEKLLTTLEACYEFYMRGFEFADIDLYGSDATKFLLAGKKTLMPPFVAIGGLGETAARDLAESRVDRQFISIDEISALCPKVSKSHLDQLRSLGALGNLPESSQLSFF